MFEAIWGLLENMLSKLKVQFSIPGIWRQLGLAFGKLSRG